ncbi:MAG: hypothetical protein HOP29_10240 [Phycisphaerales bacterium]|nr:hypothetical protein [Phycisphaerales bacterium]
MNATMGSDRMLRIAPLVLRLGIAAVLLTGGVRQISRMFGADTGESVLADNAGLSISARWESVLGIAQAAVGGLLVLGLFTRLVSAAVIAGAGYGTYTLITASNAETMTPIAQALDGSGGAMLLLAAACASLLFSGAGCLGLDCRARNAKRLGAAG